MFADDTTLVANSIETCKYNLSNEKVCEGGVSNKLRPQGARRSEEEGCEEMGATWSGVEQWDKDQIPTYPRTTSDAPPWIQRLQFHQPWTPEAGQ